MQRDLILLSFLSGKDFFMVKKIVLALVLVGLAVGERVWWDLGPNIEWVTLALVVASVYLKGWWATGVVLVAMAVSDRWLGNTSIAWFTWSGFAIPAVVGGRWLKWGKSGLRRVIRGTGLGLGANLFFYLWTNFGVWLLDSWNMYPDDLSGLMMSYVGGLPFLKLQLFSTLLFVPAGLVVMEVGRVMKEAFRRDKKGVFNVLRV